LFPFRLVSTFILLDWRPWHSTGCFYLLSLAICLYISVLTYHFSKLHAIVFSCDPQDILPFLPVYNSINSRFTTTFLCVSLHIAGPLNQRVADISSVTLNRHLSF